MNKLKINKPKVVILAALVSIGISLAIVLSNPLVQRFVPDSPYRDALYYDTNSHILWRSKNYSFKTIRQYLGTISFEEYISIRDQGVAIYGMPVHELDAKYISNITNSAPGDASHFVPLVMVARHGWPFDYDAVVVSQNVPPESRRVFGQRLVYERVFDSMRFFMSVGVVFVIVYPVVYVWRMSRAA
jgi:hypothetical protein